MKLGAPYVEFAETFRTFLRRKKYESPNDFYNDLKLHMRDRAPSRSAVWMAFYGARALPTEVILFMVDRYAFEVDWRQVLPIKNQSGASMKTNQLALPGMREIKK